MSRELFGRPSRDSPDLLLVLRPDGQPLWAQLRDAIRTGRLPAGAQLPSSRALAADFGVSRGVVVDAYAQLVAEGYLTSQSGSGTHVAATFQLPRVEPTAQQTPAPAGLVEFDLRADRPDPALFPRRKWVSATRDAVRDLADGDLGYPHPLGNSGLRIELASYLGRVRGAVVAPETVLIVAGVTQGLVLPDHRGRLRRGVPVGPDAHGMRAGSRPAAGRVVGIGQPLAGSRFAPRMGAARIAAAVRDVGASTDRPGEVEGEV